MIFFRDRKKTNYDLVFMSHAMADWDGGKPGNFPVGRYPLFRIRIYLIYYLKIFRYLTQDLSNHSLLLFAKKTVCSNRIGVILKFLFGLRFSKAIS